MSGSSIFRWVVASCWSLRLSQRKTLGELVLGAMRCRRVSIADIGRSLQTDALAKHSIKRVYRFLKNHRVEATEGCKALIALAIRASGGCLVVAVDWVDVGQYKALRAAVPLRGRSMPILFAAYRKWEVHRSQNAFEEGFFRLLRAMLPRAARAVVIADRGFGRTDLLRTLQQLGLSYVVRVAIAVWFISAKHEGRLDDLPMRPGVHKDLGFGRFRKSRPLRQRVVVWWKAHQKEPWFLATDLQWGWRKVCAAYGLRMMIEELFRDEKSLRYGWGLRQLKLSEPERLERMLLVLALAYVLLLLLGLWCRRELSPAHWASGTSRRHQNSAFFIGRLMQQRVRLRLPILFALLRQILTQMAEANWG